MPDPKRTRAHAQTVVTVLKFTGLGWIIAANLIVPTLIGVWLDAIFNTEFIFIVVGVVIGALVTPVSIWQFVRIFFKNTNKNP